MDFYLAMLWDPLKPPPLSFLSHLNDMYMLEDRPLPITIRSRPLALAEGLHPSYLLLWVKAHQIPRLDNVSSRASHPRSYHLRHCALQRLLWGLSVPCKRADLIKTNSVLAVQVTCALQSLLVHVIFSEMIAPMGICESQLQGRPNDNIQSGKSVR